MTYFTPEYKAYIGPPRSDAWEAKRQRKFRQVGRRCQKCRRWHYQLRQGEWLEVHHLTYKRLFHEWLRDLQVLCNTCHRIETLKKRGERQIHHTFAGWF